MSAAAMAKAVSGLAYPEQFYTASTYIKFGGSPNSAAKGISPKFSNEVALLVYALYQQNHGFFQLFNKLSVEDSSLALQQIRRMISRRRHNLVHLFNQNEETQPSLV